MDLLWISFLVFQTCLSQYLTKVCTFFLKIFSKNYWGTRVPSPHAGWQRFYIMCNYCYGNKIQLMKRGQAAFSSPTLQRKIWILKFTIDSSLHLKFQHQFSFGLNFSNTNRNKFIFCTGCLLKGSRAIQRATSCCN